MDWSRVWDEAKAHPYVVGGAILVLVILLWWLMSRGSSSSSGTLQVATPTEDPNVIAANTALTENQQNNSAAVSLAGIQLQSDQASLGAAQAINLQNTNAQVAIATSTNGTALSIAGLQAGVLTTQANDALTLGKTQANDSLAAILGVANQQASVLKTQAADALAAIENNNWASVTNASTAANAS